MKFKLVSAHAMKLRRGGSANPLFPNLDTRSREWELHAPAAIPPGKGLPISTEQEWVRPINRLVSWRN